MRRLLRTCIAAVCGAVMVALAAGQALAERRVALVVGNSQYKSQSLFLSNPKNDAEDVSAALRTLGFEVIQKIDASKRDLELAMAQFARQSTNADVALFFYAGHALQYQGHNYLMPTDSTLEDEVSLRYQMMAIDDVRAALDRASGVKIMILDACRNNPVVDVFKRKMSGPSRALDTVRGLARIDKTEGMVVAYATAADDVAADGSGRNSPYTSALLKRLQEPGLEIEIMFRRIAADVNAQTNGRQRPETYVSLINEYYLNQQDRLAWEKIKDSTDLTVLDDFIRRYPQSMMTPDALARERQIEREASERMAAQMREEQQRRAQAAAAERERTEREAASRRQQEEQQKAAVAAAAAERERVERERVEREATLKRQQEDEQRRAQAAAAAAEKERAEREAVLKRQQEEQQKAAAAAEKGRVEREAALKRQQEEQQKAAAAASAEKERLEREAAAKRQQEELLRRAHAAALAAAENQRAEREAAQRRAEEEAQRVAQEQQRMKLASVERERQEAASAQRLRDEEQRRRQAEAERQKQAALQTTPAPAQQEQACKRDADQLARLRASQDKDEIVRFERALTCERLRPQVMRLRESLVGTEEASRSATASPTAPVMAVPAAPQPSPEEQRQKTDADRRGLERESVLNTAPPAAAAPAVAAVSPEEACKRDSEKLTRLRASQSREEVVRFERELGCERLRPQVVRLRESLTGN